MTATINNSSPGDDLQMWAGIECTINRVGDVYYDQLHYSGHYGRCAEDLEALAATGIKTLRYPVLWERHEPQKGQAINWDFAKAALGSLRENGITPIAGLVHHGSGPTWVSFLDGTFEEGLRDYALRVATQFPWIEYYTPVNEPLTTARFCGLYGHWFPHGCSTADFARILVSECKGIIMAMEAIRTINPAARLVQTEDLGKTYSTPLLRYQADHENRRRWLAFDLVGGQVTPQHRMWRYLTEAGISEDELQYFLDHGMAPEIIGLNYYITSERYLDEALAHYPDHTHGGNGIHQYADVEAVRVPVDEETGLAPLLREAWQRYGQPIAITEVHLHCAREHQCRWLHQVSQTAAALRTGEGIDIRAVTAWAAFGSFGWNQLLRQPNGTYEPGIFDVRGGHPRPTAIASLVRSLVDGCSDHPVLQGKGWWERESRLLYRTEGRQKAVRAPLLPQARPLLILGKTGTLGRAFSRICTERGIHHVLWGRHELDIGREQDISEKITGLNSWAVINATGYVRVEDAEHERSLCFGVNCAGAVALAAACHAAGIQLLSFSSDLVFNGAKCGGYTEQDTACPLNVYGSSKAAAEAGILQHHPASMIVRTSAFFGPWDEYNFVHAVMRELNAGRSFRAAADVTITPTYIPDLVNECLDLLLDDAQGIWHITNGEAVTWAAFARLVAVRSGHKAYRIQVVSQADMGWKAQYPRNSALASTRGISLPSLHHALDRYFAATKMSARNAPVAR